MNREKLNELLFQALETELGGVEVYQTAIRCAVNDDLKEEWGKYLEQTKTHVEVVNGIFEVLKLDPETITPGRMIVRSKGESLVSAMEKSLAGKSREEAQLVAAECVVDAETKDHQNWELLGEAAKALKGDEAKAVKDAVKQVEEQEDEHLYHTAGWARELWMETLGLPAVLPPPEERREVKTEIGAARAKQERGSMVSHGSRRH